MQEKAIIALKIPKGSYAKWHEALVLRLNDMNPDFTFFIVEAEQKSPFHALTRAYIRFESFKLNFSKEHLALLPLPKTTLRAYRTLALGCEGNDYVVKFNGETCYNALLTCLMNGETPHIALTKGDKTIISMKPMIDLRNSLSSTFLYVEARLASLITAYLNGKRFKAEMTQSSLPLTQNFLFRYTLKIFKYKSLSIIKKALFYSPHWQVFYREKPVNKPIGDLTGAKWHKIPNPPFRFLADPFPYNYRGKDYIFVEDLDHRSKKGILSVVDVATSKVTPIIEEPHHLSFPFVFFHQGEYYLLPESGEAKELVLYKALLFPFKWVRDTVLINNQECADATPFYFNNKWWMLLNSTDGKGSMADMLYLYSSDSLKGEWHSHPQNPIKIDCSATRGAGAVIEKDGKLYRPVQNCEKGYGHSVNLYEITTLNSEMFEEKLVSNLKVDGGDKLWRLHTYNQSSSLETIDGSGVAVKVVEWVRARLNRA
jgi:hypothetical protein